MAEEWYVFRLHDFEDLRREMNRHMEQLKVWLKHKNWRLARIEIEDMERILKIFRSHVRFMESAKKEEE